MAVWEIFFFLRPHPIGYSLGKIRTNQQIFIIVFFYSLLQTGLATFSLRPISTRPDETGRASHRHLSEIGCFLMQRLTEPNGHAEAFFVNDQDDSRWCGEVRRICSPPSWNEPDGTFFAKSKTNNCCMLPSLRHSSVLVTSFGALISWTSVLRTLITPLGNGASKPIRKCKFVWQ